MSRIRTHIFARTILILLLGAGAALYADDYPAPKMGPRPAPLPVLPYHGLRVPPMPEREFCVEEIFAREHDGDHGDHDEHGDEADDDGDEDSLEILVRFSLPIDPRTLDKDSVLRDKKGRSIDADYEFNRQGTVVRIRTKGDEDEHLTLILDGICAFNGEPLLKEKLFDDIEEGYVYYEGGSEWRRF